MTTVQTIAKNTGVLLFANVIVGILAFVLAICMPRYLGDVEFGKYSFALAFTSLFAILSHIGFDIVVTRDVARDRSQAGKYFGNVALIELIFSITTLLLISITINLMNYPCDTKLAVYILGIAVLLEVFTLLSKSIYRAFEKMEYEALVLISGKCIFVCFGFFVLFSGYGLIELVSAYLLANFITFLFSFLITIKKFTIPKFEVDTCFWKYLVLTAIPFGLAGVLNLIYVRTDTIMLSLMKGDAVVGWYNAAYTLVSALSFINAALITAIFPPMSNAFVSSKKSLNGIYEKSFKYSLIFLLPIAVGTPLLADRIILLVYGESFIHSIIALQILIWSGVLSFLNGLHYTTLGAINRVKTVSIIMGIGAIVNVFLNLLLIPKLSYIGAGIATIITQGTCLMLAFYFMSKYLYRLPMRKTIIKPIIASLGMGFFVFYFQNVNLLILVFTAAIVYLVIFAGINGFDKEDWQLLKRLIKRGE